MKHKLILLVLAISIIWSGCINTGVKPTGNITEKFIKINYIDKNTIIKGEDFPDFKLVHNVYYIAPENLSLTSMTEMGHGVYEIDPNTTIISGYRIYGGSETYSSRENSSKRYMLLQYKVFDSNESLNYIIDMTAENIYIKNGYKYKSINNTHTGRVVVLESNVTNHTDMNVIIILFGFDTVIGKIGVQDSKDKSFSESLKILDIAFDRLKVRTKEVKAAKMGSIISSNMSNNRSNNKSGV